jgi:hypothetical protein
MDVEIRPPSNDTHNLVIFILTADSPQVEVGDNTSVVDPQIQTMGTV